MKKILFLIRDLGQGGAEKVLVSLVNHMDPTEFDITVMTLFDTGVNRQFLAPHIRYRSCFHREIRGSSKLMKLLTPELLHRWLIRERYDIEVAYLEGPSARVISGCRDKQTKLVCWVHTEFASAAHAAASFRSVHEATWCYNRFHNIVAVSAAVRDCLKALLPITSPVEVLYNTNETEKIRRLSQEPSEELSDSPGTVRLIGVGKLLKSKGFDRLARIGQMLLSEGYQLHIYILGSGPEEKALRTLSEELGIGHAFTLLGYQTNPYRIVAGCDLFVCASLREGFSTAATEALIVGTPVCTVDVSGMKEMLGANNEYGIVTDNTEEALYGGIKQLLDHPALLAHYREQAKVRGAVFQTRETVKAVEDMLLRI